MADARRERLERATAGLEPPFAVVDLDAFWRNAADMERRAASKPIRLASKSVRCRSLQERVLARPGFQGTLAFTLPEALWLEELGFRDIVVAYPSVDREALRTLARRSEQAPGVHVAVMVDSIAQLDLIEAAIDSLGGEASGSALPGSSPSYGAPSSTSSGSASSGGPSGGEAPGNALSGSSSSGGEVSGGEASGSTLPGRGASDVGRGDGIENADVVQSGEQASIEVCIDLDAGLWMLDGRIRIGAKRSPVHTPEQAATLAWAILERKRLRLVGIMAYESQIAGLGDSPSGRRLRGAAIRVLQRRSSRELFVRRAAAVAAVQEVLRGANAAPLRFVNGGGTGSLESTGAESAVTEIAAGSGLYGPTLFDAYRAFRPEPAALFALPVVRKPSATVATVLGGGYLASGPADAARLPAPFLPAGLALDKQEGAGEVQTPLMGARELQVGDRVWFRHAKAGELCERFDRLHLIEGGRIVEEVPTYRGEGKCFL
jgi:D-serine deaminase-like pyridoxal phosphate-dependent protein